MKKEDGIEDIMKMFQDAINVEAIKKAPIEEIEKLLAGVKTGRRTRSRR